MRLLLDTSKGGSDAGYSSAADRQAREADDQFFSDDQTPQYEGENYQGADLASGSGGTSSRGGQQRHDLISQAKQNIQQGKAAFGKAAKSIGGAANDALGGEGIFGADSPKDRERVKEQAKQKARDFAKDQVSKRLANEGAKKGLEKGLSKGVSSLAKEGAKKAAGKAAGKLAAKGAGQAATKGLQTAVTAGAGASGFETLGLGFLVGFLLNIAISLGVSDAVDAGFALKDGDAKQAFFLAVRAAAKVGVFIYMLVIVGAIFSIAGALFAIPLLFLLNIYMLAGLVFKKNPFLQGLVWWEIAIVIFIDIIAFLIVMAFIGALGWYLCKEAGLDNTGGVTGAATSIVLWAYDWWNSSQIGSVASDFCKYVGDG